MRRFRLRSLAPLIPLALLMILFLPPSVSAARPISEVVRRSVPADPEENAVCLGGTQASGALYETCVPLLFPPWNGELLVYAHGYVSPEAPIAIPPEFDDLSFYANLMGYGTATTSYRVNGLAVRPGQEDLLDLVEVFRGLWGDPDRLYLVGPSMGGLITTLMVEQGQGDFDGGLAICAPNGDFRAQIDYVGDFRVVFDYFFPGLMPGSPIDIPPSLIETWDQHFNDVILPAISDPANQALLDQIFAVTGAATDPADPASRVTTVRQLLWYNVFATNDGTAVLGGQPFENVDRVYTGSADDTALNAGVARFSADPGALAEIAAFYETTGQLFLPVLTDHTTLDELVPFWHSDLYAAKVAAAGADLYFKRNLIARYGHCNFTPDEVLNDFLELVEMVDNPPPPPTPSPSPTITLTPSPTASPTPTPTVTPANWTESIYIPVAERR